MQRWDKAVFWLWKNPSKGKRGWHYLCFPMILAIITLFRYYYFFMGTLKILGVILSFTMSSFLSHRFAR